MEQESVLVIPKFSLEKIFSLFSTKLEGNVITGTFLFDRRYDTFCYLLENEAEYRNRADVEDDLNFVQVIPYVVLVKVKDDELKVLTYNRGSKGGEKRLANKWSIGVGGHINPEDGLSPNIDVVTNAAKREVKEEVIGLDMTKTPLVPHGVFYTDTTKVSAVHLGVFCLAISKNGNFDSMGDHIEEYRWEPIKRLREYELEDWSSIVLTEFLPSVSVVGADLQLKFFLSANKNES